MRLARSPFGPYPAAGTGNHVQDDPLATTFSGIIAMPPDWSDKLISIWPDALVGTAVIVICSAVGWYTSRYRRWWLNQVVPP